ncbi:MAG TPA: HEAT repeat domain-containing protein [Humisphaera sp.]|nr:HEAT repeat domain-containing protein [Humisphaera sp.]
MLIDQLLAALTASKNQAADDVLAEALQLGTEKEKWPVLQALCRRQSVRGLCGVIEQYESLPEGMQRHILTNAKLFHHALREAGRSDSTPLRLAALRLIALSRQGKLGYVLSENLHSTDEVLSKTATEAMVALARWIATETKRLQKGMGSGFGGQGSGEEGTKGRRDEGTKGERQEGTEARRHEGTKGNAGANSSSQTEPRTLNPEPSSDRTLNPEPSSDRILEAEPSAPTDEEVYAQLMDQRPEIEAAVARAMDVHRGRHGQDLLRAALLLCDWPGSKTLGILQTAKHGGQSPMVRRLQQPPAAEHVEAFLLGASHGQLRSHFGVVFSHIDEAPVLDALLRKTHWLKDHQLQLCMHQVSRGTWWEASSLARDIDRRVPEDACRIGEWIAVSGVHDVVQDERMEKLLWHASARFDARLRLLRIAARRKRGSSVSLFKTMLSDSDERLMRMAARELVRRRPPDYENSLLQLMTNAPESVRRVVGRAIGQTGFEQFWARFDRIDRQTRKQAGKAMLKLLPDGIARLKRRLLVGPPEQKIKALQIAQELELAEAIRDELVHLCADSNAHIRSKAISVAGDVAVIPAELLVDRLVNDPDARVRANAIEVMEGQEQPRLLPVLAKRARSAHNRERANAIKALLRMRVGAASVQLTHMLRDPRPEHRVSALWALRQSGWWQLLTEVSKLAKEDQNLRVRRYALTVLKVVAQSAKDQQQRSAG